MAEESREDHGALFCDTNVLVRILTDAPQDQAEAAAWVLDHMWARVILTDVVVAEVAYVMTDVVGASKADVARRIGEIIDLPSIEVSDDVALHDALELWSSNRQLDFADAYLAALDRRTLGTSLLSFDQDFDRIEGVARMDPRDVVPDEADTEP